MVSAGEVSVILSAYAETSLEERAATAVLDREDEGYLTWTPAGIYDHLSQTHAELYPTGPAPKVVLEKLGGPAFLSYLDDRRRHRFASRLPAAIMSESIGRRVVELCTGEIYKRLNNPAQLACMDIDQLRKLWKDGLSLIMPAAAKGGKHKEEENPGLGALTLSQLREVTAALPLDQREAVMAIVVNELAAPALVFDVQVADET